MDVLPSHPIHVAHAARSVFLKQSLNVIILIHKTSNSNKKPAREGKKSHWCVKTQPRGTTFMERGLAKCYQNFLSDF